MLPGQPSTYANLIYIYRELWPTNKVPEIAHFTIDNLLIVPDLTNNLGWRRGYYETVANIDLASIELLPRHVFVSHAMAEEKYYDEHGHSVLPEHGELIGIFGLASYLSTEYRIAEALGLDIPG